MKEVSTNLDWYKGNKYLVYQIGCCEMGSEGTSSYYGYAICEGNTEEEIIESYKKQRDLLYGVPTNPKKMNGKWYDYYEIVWNPLPTSSIGNATKLIVGK